MGRHNLDLFADPQRQVRSLKNLFFWVELGLEDSQSALSVSLFGKPRRLVDLLISVFAVASYDERRSERNKDTKEKQLNPAVSQSACNSHIWNSTSLNHALGAYASLRVSTWLASSPFRKGGCLPSADKEVTWLILPVVICLSQRLSHACLSINNFIL